MRFHVWWLLSFLIALAFAAEGAERKFTYSVRPGGGGPRDLFEVSGGGIAVDALGQAHVLQQPGTVLKMNVAGNAALYSTSIPAAREVGAIALDAQGNAYVTGLVAVGRAFQPTTRLPGVGDGEVGGIFVMKLDSAGRMVYSLILSTTPDRSGTPDLEGGNAIALDAEGNAYVGGTTIGGIVTTAGAFQATRPVEEPCATYGSLCRKGFVAKINAAGTGLVWSTYLGGKRLDGVKGLAVDNAGAVYAGGYTTSANFPVTAGAIRSTLTWNTERGYYEPFEDGFLVKLSADGRRMEYGTLLGGEYPDEVQGVAVDNARRAHLVGYTKSPEFPLKNEMQNEPFWGVGPGWSYPNPKAFLSILDGAGRLEFSTFFGPWNGTEASTITLGPDGSVYLGGSTWSSDLPAVEAPQPSFRAGNCLITSRLLEVCRGGYFARIRPDLRRLIFSTFVGGYWAGNDRGVTDKGNQYDYVRGVALGRDGAVFATGYTRSPFPTVGVFGVNTGATFVTRMESVGEVQANAIPPVFTRESVVMAPSGFPVVMRGSWVSIYGRNFLPRGGTVVAETLPLPTELAGVSVSFNGHAGRILSIASTSEWDQINVQVPWDIDGLFITAVVVSREGVASYVTYVVNQFQKPEVFRTATGEALVLHAADFSLVTRERPARPGEFLVLYATGLGPVDPPARDGEPSPTSPLSLTRYNNMVVTVSGSFVTPLFSGLAPGLVGIFQVNFMLPADAAPGENMIGIRFGTPAKMWVQ